MSVLYEIPARLIEADGTVRLVMLTVGNYTTTDWEWSDCVSAGGGGGGGITQEDVDDSIATHAADAGAHGSFASATHNHDGTYATAGHNHDADYAAIDHIHPGGGSDPWTYFVLGSDFTTTSGTAVNVTGMAFTPSANTRYEFEASLYLQTATATVGPRPGLAAAPSGLTHSAARISAPSSATAEILSNWVGNASAALSTGLPAQNVTNLGTIRGAIVAGATPSGSVQMTLQSESAGTTVRVMAGSFLKWRTYT